MEFLEERKNEGNNLVSFRRRGNETTQDSKRIITDTKIMRSDPIT